MQTQPITGLDAVLRSQDRATLTVSTPSGARVRLRSASLIELGDIVSEHPLANLIFFGAGTDDLADESFLSRALREIPGALCALVATCADRPGDELTEKGLRHVDAAEFFPLLKGSVEVTFPLGLAGKKAQLMEYLTAMGIKWPGRAPAAPPAPEKGFRVTAKAPGKVSRRNTR